MLSITRQISNYNHSNGNTIQYLVIHDTGCPTTDTAKNNADYFGGGDRQASAHYFVDSNSIYQVVEELQASWHCGDGGDRYGIGNHNSIGIEMCKSNGTISDLTINNTLDLIKSLMSKHHIDMNHVVRHYDASRKICPGSFSANNWAKWNEFKAKLNVQPVQPQVQQFPIHMTANIQDTGIVSTSSINSCKIGTEGKSKRLEMFSMTIDGVDFTYSIHEENIGDTLPSIEGSALGTIGIAKRIEGITINVTKIPVGYKLQYQAHIQDIGNTGFVDSGAFCGTKGKSLRVEEIEVRVVKA